MKPVALIAMAFLLLGSVSSLARTGLPEFTELIERASPAVVKINTREQVSRPRFPQLPPGQSFPEMFRHFFEQERPFQRPAQSMGSGFIVSDDGYILTNFHVVEGADQIQVRLLDRREYDARVIGTDKRSDLALLKIDESGLPTLKFAADDDLKVGQWVLAIGSPFGLDFSASAGIVSAIGRSIPSDENENYVPFIQTDVAINPGNSGGPLFNLDGEVVGINSQIYTRSGGSIGLSFAIPVSVARSVIGQLKDKGHVDRGWLGVVIQEVDRELAETFALDKPSGALIAQLEPGGPADRSGLKVGDIILRFGKSDIARSGDLPHAVGQTRPGARVKVVIMREGVKRNLQVMVGTLGGEVATLPGAEQPVKDTSGGRLGLVVDAVDESLLQRWHLEGGVMIQRVIAGGAAAKAGLQIGDIVVQLGFETVTDLRDFAVLEASLPQGEPMPVRFYRSGNAVFRSITLTK